MRESSPREKRMRALVLFSTLGTTLLMAAPALWSLGVVSDDWERNAWGWLTGVWVVAISFDLWATLAPIHFWSEQGEDAKRKVELVKWLSRGAPPQVGVGVFIRREKFVLFAVRKYEPAKGKLDLIGGFVESNETAEEGALREVEEETKLVIEPDNLTYLGSIPDIYRNDTMPTLNLIYVAVDKTTKDPIPSDDVEKLDWYPLNKLPEEFAFPHQNLAVRLFRAWAVKNPD